VFRGHLIARIPQRSVDAPRRRLRGPSRHSGAPRDPVGSAAGLVGEPYRDADGTEYLPMLRQPVIVLTGDADLLSRARAKAAAREDVAVAIYTRDLFATMHDEANRAAVAAVPAEDLDLVGVALRGPRNVVDRLAKGAVFHA
jgi:hypothetical protein